MHAKLKKAVFPVAGLGSRFLPVTKASPKEMLPIVDKPLIQYAVEEAAAAGITEMIFVTGRNKRAIEDHFDKAYELETELERKGKDVLLDMVRSVLPEGCRCIYIRQSEPLGLGHAVLCAQPAIGDAPFAAVNADLHADYPFERLRGALAPDADAHLVLVDNPAHHPRGDFALDRGRVANTGPTMLTFSGIGVYRPSLFAAIVPGEKAQLAPLLRAAAGRGRVSGEHFHGRWIDVGTPERLAALDAELRGGAGA